MYRTITEPAGVILALALALLAGPASALKLPDGVDLVQIRQDGALRHEQVPRGVPRGYDWALAPRIGAGNRPGEFRAATGWGQVFRADDTKDADAALQLRDLQVLLCAGAQREWQLVQRGTIEGRQFQADYNGDLSRAARLLRQVNGYVTVAIDAGSSFHFWPARGRFDLPPGELCGFVMLVQARLDPAGSASEPGYLVGLGGDYWLDRSAPWDRYRTNRDIAIGRLRVATTDWRWYGMSTATEADLQRLATQGYALSAPLCREAAPAPCR